MPLPAAQDADTAVPPVPVPALAAVSADRAAARAAQAVRAVRVVAAVHRTVAVAAVPLLLSREEVAEVVPSAVLEAVAVPDAVKTTHGARISTCC